MNAQETIQNLINGNVSDAKRAAKRISYAKLHACARDVLGLPEMGATLAAGYLKDQITWETYCEQSCAESGWKNDPAEIRAQHELKFISITRRFTRGSHEVSEDTASLSLNGRASTPGFVQVVGGLEHNAEIAPKTDADRRALIAWLQSDECRAVVKKTTCYTFRFHGRLKGAIGVFSEFEQTTEGENEQEAALKLYDTHQDIRMIGKPTVRVKV